MQLSGSQEVPGRLRRPGRFMVVPPACLLLAMALICKAHAAPISIPAGAPSLEAFQAAAFESVNPSAAPGGGLTPIFLPSGQATISTANEITAVAYLDATGNILVGFAYATTAVGVDLAEAVLSGADPSQLPGFADALAFTRTVIDTAALYGIPQQRIFLSGFSLGGMLGSYVASRTGLAGVAFGSCGLPGYAANGDHAGNFLSFVEVGDPVAEYATDGSGNGSAIVANPAMDHYGTVIPLGSAQEAAMLAPFYAQIVGYSIRTVENGTTPVSPAQITAMETEESTLQGLFHQEQIYTVDSSAFARSVGIDPAAP